MFLIGGREISEKVVVVSNLGRKWFELSERSGYVCIYIYRGF